MATERAKEFLRQVAHAIFFDPGSRVAIFYLVPTVVIAAWAVKRAASVPAGRVLSTVFDPAVYKHRSHVTDLQLMLLGFVLQVLGALSLGGLTTLLAVLTIEAMQSFGVNEAIFPSTLWTAAALTLGVATAADFGTYWVHRIHHKVQLLWPFHKVHHSAEVMTPFTFYRKHPVYDAFHNVIAAIVVGSIEGVFIALVVGKPSLVAVGGANAVFVVFNAAGGNLRHSHIWLSYPPWLSKVLISPAQHQIHHSRDARHRDKNFGEVFALWDWMFGTLYVPVARETLEFGLVDAQGRVDQPHDGLAAALFGPFGEALQSVRKKRLPS